LANTTSLFDQNNRKEESPFDFDFYVFFRFLLHIFLGVKLSNGHSPQIRETRSLLVRMCRGESHFFQKWPLANVSESGESQQTRLANVGESGKYLPSLLMNVGTRKIGRFMHK
jgi:hypothetical protein